MMSSNSKEVKMTQKEMLAQALAKIAELELQLKARTNHRPKSEGGRKSEVLTLLKTGPQSTDDIVKALGISKKNVHSQIVYLKDDGWVIHKDDVRRYYLAQPDKRS